MLYRVRIHLLSDFKKVEIMTNKKLRQNIQKFFCSNAIALEQIDKSALTENSLRSFSVSN